MGRSALYGAITLTALTLVVLFLVTSRGNDARHVRDPTPLPAGELSTNTLPDTVAVIHSVPSPTYTGDPTSCPVDTPLSGTWYLPEKQEWANTNCGRTFTSRSDCLLEKDAVRLAQWNFTDAQWRFRPHNCTLREPRSVEESRKLLNGRTIIFFGDSVMMSHMNDASCQWTFDTKGTKTFRRLKDAHPHKSFFPGLGDLYTNVISWPGGNMTVVACWAMTSSALSVNQILPSLFARYPPHPRNVFVANHGLHGDARSVRRNTEFALLWFRNYSRLPDAPLFLWRETFPQHFDSWDGTYEKELLNHRCRLPQQGSDFYNRRTNPIVKREGMPILYVFNATWERWREHTGVFSNSSFDCTHFCIPSSPLRHATRMLVHHVMTLRP